MRDTDRYGRLVGEVLLPDGRNLNHELVRAGMAWWYRRYAQEDTTLAQLEAEARAARRGLWRDPHPVPPWEWRRTQRQGQRPSSAVRPAARCAPSYPDVCIPPPPPDLDCKDIPYRRFRVLPPDPHRFDGDGDGIGCER